MRALARTLPAIAMILFLLCAHTIANAASPASTEPPEIIEKETALFLRAADALERTRKLGARGRTAYIDKRAIGARYIYVVVEISRPKNPDERAPVPATLTRTEDENGQSLVIAATLSSRAAAKKAIKQMSAEGINAFIIETGKGGTPGYSIVVTPGPVAPPLAPPVAPIVAPPVAPPVAPIKEGTLKEDEPAPVEAATPAPVAPAKASSQKKLKKDIDIFQSSDDALQLTRELGAKGRIAFIEKRRIKDRDMYAVVEIYTEKAPEEQPSQPVMLPEVDEHGPVEAAAPAPVAPTVAPPVAPIKAGRLKMLKKDIDIFLKRETALLLVNNLGAKGRIVHIETRFVGAGEMHVVVEVYTAKTRKEQPPQPATLPSRGHMVVATLTSKAAAVNALRRLTLKGVEAHVIVTHEGGAPAYSFVVNPRVVEPQLLPEPGSIKTPPPQGEAPKTISFEYELNPYYTNADLFLSLTNAPIPDAGERSELEIYRDLFLGSYIPRFMVLEVSVYPMPLAGVWLKEQAPEFYSKADVGDNFNFFQAVTEGFEEPWAVSLFLGNVMNFKRSGSPEFEGGNKGFMGYLLSVGNLHIKDNVLIDDNWTKIEWKIKGDRDYPKQKLSWSFRIGAKYHGHPEITNVYYVAVRRSRLDFEAESSSIRHNSAFEYTFLFDQVHMAAVQHEFSVEKKFPQKGKKYAFTLALGVIYDKDRKYTGALDDRDGDSYSIIIRPNIEF
ncbi:MAG: hypothetical protein KAR83_08360 [Thermodesulfovibrionales bacterium]|nr:hypothetical protein [Thermodesulfovibrionales bacterium]